MGFLSNILGSKPDFPELEANHPAAALLNNHTENIEKLINQVSSPLEVVPTEGTSYVFIGKPPKKFGIAWFDQGGPIVNFKTLIDQKGFTVPTLDLLSEKLKNAYIQHQAEPRYMTKIKDRDIVVTPSEDLIEDVKKVINEALNKKGF